MNNKNKWLASMANSSFDSIKMAQNDLTIFKDNIGKNDYIINSLDNEILALELKM
jgi:hypothetical protein